MIQLPELTFASADPEQMAIDVVGTVEGLLGRTLARADPLRLFLRGIEAIIIQQRLLIDKTAKDNLLAYATGDNLDHLGLLVGCQRLTARAAVTIMNVVEAGDEIISSGGLFGGTSNFFRELKSFGVNVRYVDENRVENFAELITGKTKLIYTETIGNPKLDVTDIIALANLAHENNLPLIVDSTVTTPYLVRPLELGADVVIHSTSKMINGGGNSIGGVVVSGKNFHWNAVKFPKLAEYENFGTMSYLVRLRAKMLTDFGGCPSPFNIFLTNVGLDTLALRMNRACENALTLAKFLSAQKNIRVNYPGLESNPYRELAAKQFGNRFGTMLTVNFSDRAKAFGFLDALKFALKVSNIGDVRTLVVHPASTIYFDAGEREKLNAGVTDSLIRVNVGIEDIEDLREDFEQALRRTQ